MAVLNKQRVYYVVYWWYTYVTYVLLCFFDDIYIHVIDMDELYVGCWTLVGGRVGSWISFFQGTIVSLLFCQLFRFETACWLGFKRIVGVDSAMQPGYFVCTRRPGQPEPPTGGYRGIVAFPGSIASYRSMYSSRPCGPVSIGSPLIFFCGHYFTARHEFAEDYHDVQDRLFHYVNVVKR